MRKPKGGSSSTGAACKCFVEQTVNLAEIQKHHLKTRGTVDADFTIGESFKIMNHTVERGGVHWLPTCDSQIRADRWEFLHESHDLHVRWYSVEGFSANSVFIPLIILLFSFCNPSGKQEVSLSSPYFIMLPGRGACTDCIVHQQFLQDDLQISNSPTTVPSVLVPQRSIIICRSCAITTSSESKLYSAAVESPAKPSHLILNFARKTEREKSGWDSLKCCRIKLSIAEFRGYLKLRDS